MKFLILLFVNTLLALNGFAADFDIDRVVVSAVIENASEPDNPWLVDGDLPMRKWKQIQRWTSELKHVRRKGGDRSRPLRALSVYWVEIVGYKNGSEVFIMVMPHEGLFVTIPNNKKIPVTGALVSSRAFSSLSALLANGVQNRKNLYKK